LLDSRALIHGELDSRLTRRYFVREATMTDPADIVVRKLIDADVHATAEVLASAFADNPAYGWMHPRAATRAQALRAFFERNLRWHLPSI
jgi:hypothetical protein